MYNVYYNSFTLTNLILIDQFHRWLRFTSCLTMHSKRVCHCVRKTVPQPGDDFFVPNPLLNPPRPGTIESRPTPRIYPDSPPDPRRTAVARPHGQPVWRGALSPKRTAEPPESVRRSRTTLVRCRGGAWPRRFVRDTWTRGRCPKRLCRTAAALPYRRECGFFADSRASPRQKVLARHGCRECLWVCFVIFYFLTCLRHCFFYSFNGRLCTRLSVETEFFIVTRLYYVCRWRFRRAVPRLFVQHLYLHTRYIKFNFKHNKTMKQKKKINYKGVENML